MQRLRELDSVRGLAALAIMLGHNFEGTGAIGPSIIGSLRSTPFRPIVEGRSLVLLFFVLSGFVLSHSLRNRNLSPVACARWIAQRSIRLIVPAAMSVFLSAALYSISFGGSWSDEPSWLQSSNWLSPPNAGSVLQQSLLLSSSDLNCVLWSLQVEWRLSLLLPFMVWFALRRPRGPLALVLGAVGISSLAGGTWPSDLGGAYVGWAAVQDVLYMTLPFALGVALERSGLTATKADPLTIAVAAIAVVGLARARGDLPSILGSVVLIWLVQQPTRFRSVMRLPLLTWIGTVSYSLYLVHVPLENALFHALHARLTTPALAMLSAALAFPAAWAFHILVERPVILAARSLPFGRAPAISGAVQGAA